ncbi:MAG: peptidase MA family metallohydrolase [Deltaproteobacteria bacterium]|nr:peptidase MA family metallohydrolase [Deltaproteobacteria bacterium]
MKTITTDFPAATKKNIIRVILLLAFLLFQPGQALFAQEDFPEESELESIEKSIEALLPSEEKDELRSRYYLILAREKLNNKEFEETLNLLENNSEYIRDEKTATLMRGIACYFTGSHYEAEAELLNIAYDDGGNKEALNLLGSIYYERGDLTIAIEHWQWALSLEKENAELKAMIAKAKREAAVESKMEKTFTGRFLINYDGRRDEKTGHVISGILEEAYYDVGTDLNFFPEKEISVIIYTEKEFKEVTLAPGWAGGLYDGKIRIPSGGAELSSMKLRQLIYHEYTHAVIHLLAGGMCPRWLNEGIAMYEESKVNAEGEQFKASPKSNIDISSSGDIDLLLMSDNADKALFAYRQSYSLARNLIDNYGIHKIAGLLKALGKNKPFKKTFNQAYGNDNLSFDTWWKNVYKD